MFERLKIETTWRRTATERGSNSIELTPQSLSQLVINQVSDAVFVVDPEGNIVDANPAACQMLKFSLEELRCLHGLDLSCDHEATLDVIAEQIAEHEAGRPPQPERLILKCRDGSQVIVESVSHPLLDQHGDLIGYVTFNRDVTHEQEQSAEIELLSKIVEQVESGIAMVKVEADHLTARFGYVNPAFEKLMGIEAKHLLGKKIPLLKPDRALDEISSRVYDECREKGIPGRAHSIIKRPDGTERIVEVFMNPIRDPNGEITHWVGLHNDVTIQFERDQRLKVLERSLEQLDIAYAITRYEGSKGVIEYANPAWERVTGYSREEIIGQSLPPMIVEDPQNTISRQSIADAFHSKQSLSGISRAVRTDGTEFVRELQIGPVTDASGKATHWYSLTKDITEQLDQSERIRLLSSAVDQSPVATVIASAGSGPPIVTYVNKAWEHLYGGTAQDALGRPWQESQIAEPIDHETSIVLTEARLAGDAGEGVLTFTDSEGQERFVHATLNPIKDARGVITHWVGTSTDITEQKHVERHTRLLERALRQSPSAKSIVSASDQVISYVNPAFEEMTGYSAAEMIGRNIQEFWLEHTVEGPDDYDPDSIVAGGVAHSVRALCRRKDGTQFYRDVIITPVFDANDEISHWLSSSKDVTEVIADQEEIKRLNSELESRVEKRTEQLRSANENLWDTLKNLKKTQTKLIEAEKYASLSNLVAGVAHEINTPVGIAVTAASMVSDQLTTLIRSYQQGALSVEELEAFFEDQKEADTILMSNLNRASDMISSFKQVAVDQSTDGIREFGLCRYLEEVFVSLRPQLKKQKVIYRVTCPPDLSLITNPGALSQIVTNLALNSAIHAYDGTEDGIIELVASEIGDNQVQLTYRDFGAGMTEEHQKRIFEPFFTTKRGSGGSGLGMNIVYNLVSRTLKGHIKVTSTLKAGTTFEITLPRDLSQVEPEQMSEDLLTAQS